MAPSRRDQLLQELLSRRGTFTSRQEAAFQELKKRGTFEPDSPKMAEGIDALSTVQRSLQAAGVDAGIASVGLDKSAKEALAGDRSAVRAQTQKLDELTSQQEEAFAAAVQAGEGFEDIGDAPSFAKSLEAAQGNIPGVRSAISGFQQSIIGTGSAVSRGVLQDDEHASELNSIVSKLSQVDKSRGFLDKTVAGATRSLTDLITGGGGATAIPLFALKATNAAIDEGRAAGLSGAKLGRFAATQGAIEGIITTAFQLAGAGGLESALRAPIQQGLKQAAKQAGKALSFELIEEYGVELGQRLNSFLSGVDAEAFDINNLAAAAMDITAQTVLSLGAAQVPSAVQAAASRLGGADGGQSIIQRIKAARETAAAPTEEAAPTLSIQEAMAQEGEKVAERDQQRAIEQAATPQEQQAGETEGQTTTRLLGTPQQQEQAQVEQQVDEGAGDFQQLLERSIDQGTAEQVVQGQQSAPKAPEGVISKATAARTPEGSTQIKQASVDQVRKEFGMSKMSGQDARTFTDSLDAAVEQGIPGKALEIATRVNTTPEALTDVEAAGLGHALVSLKLQRTDLDTQLAKADKGQAKLLSAEVTRTQQDIEVLTRAIRTSGSEAARRLSIQRLLLTKDFEVGSVMDRATAAAGKALKPKQRTKLQKLVADIKRLNAQLAQAQQKLQASKDSKGKPKSKVLARVADKQIARLEFERSQAQQRLNRTIAALKPKGALQKIGEPLNLIRSLITSGDVSAVLRQGGKLGIADPQIAVKAFGPMFKALVSEQKAFEIDNDIRNSDNFPTAQRAGLHISDLSLDAEVSSQEEVYISRLARVIPGIRASERAFVTFLNKLRMDSFNAMVESLARNGEVTLDEAVAIANFINIATGRGDLGKFEPAAELLATTFFAPRYVVSQFQFLTLQPIRKAAGTPRVQKLIAKKYGKLLIGWSVIAGLFALAGFEIEDDETSSDFLKFKLGNTRVDLGTGLFQPIVLTARIIEGRTKSAVTGKVTALRGPDKPFGQGGVPAVIGRFLRTKLAPGGGMGLNIATGENVVGETVDVTTFEGVGRAALQNLVPISIQEILDVFQEQEIPEATILSLLSLFGAGISTFGKRETDKEKAQRR